MSSIQCCISIRVSPISGGQNNSSGSSWSSAAQQPSPVFVFLPSLQFSSRIPRHGQAPSYSSAVCTVVQRVGDKFETSGITGVWIRREPRWDVCLGHSGSRLGILREQNRSPLGQRCGDKAQEQCRMCLSFLHSWWLHRDMVKTWLLQQHLINFWGRVPFCPHFRLWVGSLPSTLPTTIFCALSLPPALLPSTGLWEAGRTMRGATADLCSFSANDNNYAKVKS